MNMYRTFWVFQETYKGTAPGVSGPFPTDQAYDMIFTTAAIVSLAYFAIAFSMSKMRTATATISIEQREPNGDPRR
jgi:hypothetical protein